MTMTIRLAEADAELEAIAPVMRELRPAFDVAGLVAQMRAQMNEGYRLAYLTHGERVLCVAGFVIGTKLAWGRHVYVDDLVTAADSRSQGAGAAMLDWLRRHARENGCVQLHLDSGVQRFAAHRFYLRHGFDISSHHFSIEDLGEA